MRAEDGCLLRIFSGERDKHAGRPLYEWIIAQAQEQQLAGATVYRGLMGFGAQTRVIHTFKIERLAEDLPIVFEVVDTSDRLKKFLTFLEQHISTGLLATLQPIEIHLLQARTE